jgi:hypothetical protein
VIGSVRYYLTCGLQTGGIRGSIQFTVGLKRDRVEGRTRCRCHSECPNIRVEAIVEAGVNFESDQATEGGYLNTLTKPGPDLWTQSQVGFPMYQDCYPYNHCSRPNTASRSRPREYPYNCRNSRRLRVLSYSGTLRRRPYSPALDIGFQDFQTWIENFQSCIPPSPNVSIMQYPNGTMAVVTSA